MGILATNQILWGPFIYSVFVNLVSCKYNTVGHWRRTSDSPLIRRPLTLLNCSLGSLSPLKCKANNKRQITNPEKKTIAKECNLHFFRSGNLNRAGLKPKFFYACPTQTKRQTDRQWIRNIILGMGQQLVGLLPTILQCQTLANRTSGVLSTWRERKARAQFNTLQAAAAATTNWLRNQNWTCNTASRRRTLYSNRMMIYQIRIRNCMPTESRSRSGLIITSWRAGH